MAGQEGRITGHIKPSERTHPQESYHQTVIEPDSFWGKLRSIYSTKVLKTQLDQLRKQGSIDAFNNKWNPVYDIRRSKGANCIPDGIPPSLAWESDVAKWIEGVCYFLSSPDGKACEHADQYRAAIDEVVDNIEKNQQPDGYMDIYFTVVDPEGRFRNLRDMHEMYCCGHMIEGALAYYHYTGSKRLINCMIKYVALLSKTFGPGKDQLHGYPGHQELELAMLRLYTVTRDPKHLEFATYLLSERGQKRADQNNKTYFVWEAEDRRKDLVHGSNMSNLGDVWYHQAHLPLHDQNEILGHSVRAFYLTTAAADLGGAFYDDARRLWTDAVDNKMYVTGGFGTEPRWEGFSAVPHFLPQSTDEGGCYAETCASIACMMTTERLLSHKLEGKLRDTMELILLNAALGGGNLDGQKFSYENKLATYGEETALRNDWFEVCCCPPNLSRTLGLLGGYTWATSIEEDTKTIHLDVYLLLSATRHIPLSGGGHATVTMTSEMPWEGKCQLEFSAPKDWKWVVRLPKPNYATDVQVSESVDEEIPGFLTTRLDSSASVALSFSMPIRLLSPNPASNQDTLNVTRGPIVYTAESVDNVSLDKRFPHFANVGISEASTFTESRMEIEGIAMIRLTTKENVYVLDKVDEKEAYRVVDGKVQARTWKKLDETLTFVPWFARANRGGAGRLRTAFKRVGLHDT